MMLAVRPLARPRNLPTPSDRPGLATTSAALVAALRKHGVLTLAQLKEVRQTLQDRFPEAKELARELLLRDWLTPYQANRLLQGRGRELVLGQYVLLARLGEGGMGQVFKARHRHMGRVAALKVIREEWLGNTRAAERFLREVEAAAALSHPNIIHAYDADQVGDGYVLVMEYLEGATDLARLLATDGPLPVDRACEYARQAALGLQHAHERGVIHRDIKPHNLLLSADGAAVKILDFGLARISRGWAEDEEGGLTRTGMVVGTVDYMAPEQASLPKAVDVRSDLYGLGCTLYHLLSGRVPFPGGSKMAKVLRHHREEPAALELLRPGLAPAVAALVRRLMAKRPQDRYQSPAEVAEALGVLLADECRPDVEKWPRAETGLQAQLRSAQQGESAGDIVPLRTDDEKAVLLPGCALTGRLAAEGQGSNGPAGAGAEAGPATD